MKFWSSSLGLPNCVNESLVLKSHSPSSQYIQRLLLMISNDCKTWLLWINIGYILWTLLGMESLLPLFLVCVCVCLVLSSFAWFFYYLPILTIWLSFVKKFWYVKKQLIIFYMYRLNLDFLSLRQKFTKSMTSVIAFGREKTGTQKI